MARLIISCWAWGSKYPSEYVDRLRAGVARNLTQPYEFRVFTPEPEDHLLTIAPGCFARLRAFDPEWQARQGLEPGDRLVCLDLDLIITGSLDGLFDRPEPFVILGDVNLSNPCPYNGSVWMLTAGYRHDVWSDFSLDAARAVPFDSFPDDQAWMNHKLPSAATFTHEDGVFAYMKKNWPNKSSSLPIRARIVAFPGWRDPSGFSHLPWVQEHWR